MWLRVRLINRELVRERLKYTRIGKYRKEDLGADG